MGTSNPTNSSIWIVNKQLITWDIYIGNFKLLPELLTLIVNICTVTLLEWLLFHFNSSRALHKIIQKCSCFSFCYYKLYSTVTQLKSWIKHHYSKIKHLNSLNQLRLKITMQNRLSPVFAMLPLTQSSCPSASFIEPNVFLWYWVNCWS